MCLVENLKVIASRSFTDVLNTGNMDCNINVKKEAKDKRRLRIQFFLLIEL